MSQFSRLVLFLAAITTIAAAHMTEASEDERLTAGYRDAFERCDFGEAAAAARAQLERRRGRLGDGHPDVARSMVRLARALVYVPENEMAESLYREALAIETRALGPRDATVAATMGELGVFLADNGRWDEADSLTSASLHIRRERFGERHAEVARGLRERGAYLYDTGQWHKADSVLTGALVMERELDGPGAASTLETALLLGKVLSDFDRSRAAPLLEDLLPRLTARFGEFHLHVAECYTALGAIHWGTQRLDRSQRAFEKALAIKKRVFPGGHPLIADELNNLGVLCMGRGEFAEGEPYLREAIAMYRDMKGDDHEDVAYALSNLAVNLSEQGRFEAAGPVYEECRAIYRAIDPAHPDLLWVTSYEGRDALRRGDTGRAEVCFEEVVNARLGQDPLNTNVINELRFLAQIAIRRGDTSAAITKLEHAATLWESRRRRNGHDVDRATATLSPYVPCALARLEAGDTAGAWRAIERARGRVIADMIVERRGPFPDTAPDDSLSCVFPLERIQRTLSPHTAIVGWIDETLAGAGPRSWAYVIRDRGPVVWERLDAGTDTLLQDLRDAVAAAGTSALGARYADEFDDAASMLYAARFAPLERHLDGARDLVVIPSASTSDCPVEFLRGPDGRFVADRYGASYAPSATIAAWLREHMSRPVRSGLFVADPPFNDRHLEWMASGTSPGEDEAYPTDTAMLRNVRDGNPEALASLPRLPWSREEVAFATRFLKDAYVLLGPDANTAALERLRAGGQLERHDVVHLATHAFVDPKEWRRCSLVLSQVAGDDATMNGLVTGGTVAAEWSLDAELVVLSACETGRGQEVPAEGTVGFAQPFFVAGARSLLVSLWKVDDRATALLMKRFYENWLGQGESKAQALREARTWLRSYRDDSGTERYRHPCYWSAFVLIGDGR